MENLNDVREPDDITEVQDFDLDDLLREFHDIVAEEPVEVEADRELEELLQMPKLTITPVVVKTSGAMAALLENSEPREEEAPVSDAPTVVFEPITEDPAAQDKPHRIQDGLLLILFIGQVIGTAFNKIGRAHV